MTHGIFSRRTLALAGAALLAHPFIAGTAAAQAQDYPSRAIRVVVPFAPGGVVDVTARILTQKMTERLGWNFIVENRPGSGTLVGTDLVAKATPDGYTLLVGSVSNLALNPGLYRNLPYDSLRDFEPVGLAVAYSYTLVARKDLPFSNLRELIAHAKANPKKLTYASGGSGSGQHVLAAALWNLAGVELVHVPYRGAQAAYQDLLGGRVDVFFDLSPTARPQVESGNLKALVVSGSARLPFHPDVPTIMETGVANLDLESWFGLFVPSKTPADVQERLRSELSRIVQGADLVETFRKAGGKPLALSGEQARALVKRDVDRWSKITRDLGIKAE
jgi:tripartite-type tricarboxylate transporter receptor subunit TctC